MNEEILRLENTLYDFTKKRRAESSIVRDDIVNMVLDKKPYDEILARGRYLQSILDNIDGLEKFPKLNVIYHEMPPGVLMMAYGANGTFTVLREDGTVEAGVVPAVKEEPCSTPTSSSTSPKKSQRKPSKRRPAR